MARMAPVPRDECKDLATVFEITEAATSYEIVPSRVSD
jgi:hypothetical protein